MTAIKAPSASRQVQFHQLLVAARTLWLGDALRETLATIDPEALSSELALYVPKEARQVLAAAGIRDEEVFPTPLILSAKPTLVGYYRLLLGAPRKTFYAGGFGLQPFEKAEDAGILTARQRARLPELCAAMCAVLSDLVMQISPQITRRDVYDLPLLTLGQFFQGQNNNKIGILATREVFLAIGEIVKEHVIERTDRAFVIANASNRRVIIALASDPDVAIQEDFETGGLQNKVALEIKGGTDRSNAHNRAGEAEKSHRKAAHAGYRDFWTIIAKKGLDMEQVKNESPTTRSWFDVAQILGRTGDDWEEFTRRIAEAVGIPLAWTPLGESGHKPLPQAAEAHKPFGDDD